MIGRMVVPTVAVVDTFQSHPPRDHLRATAVRPDGTGRTLTKDPTIREKFNTYRFADYKDKVIDLLMRVTTVSVATQKIVGAMAGSPR
jgi:hypothetical protein